MRLAPGKRRELLDTLRSAERAPPNAPSSAELFHGADDPECVCWHARWDTEAALDAFLASPAFRALRGAMRVLGVGRGVVERGEGDVPARRP